MTDEYTRAKNAIREGVRKWFTELREKFPTEHFYAVTIYTDDDFSGPEPTAHSLERLEKLYRQQGDLDDRERCYFKWAWNEWLGFPGAGVSLDAVQVAWNVFGEKEMPDEPEPWDDEYDVYREAVDAERAKRLAATFDGLKELSDEGFFGEGESRITVFCSIGDSCHAGWTECESAKRINPAEVFARYAPEQAEAASVIYGEDANQAGRLAAVYYKLFGRQ
jgi:hypothetical protein